LVKLHITDIQEDPTNPRNNLRINFIKYLVGSYPNLTDRIDVDVVWKHFLEKHLK
jgi:hypothetical protein